MKKDLYILQSYKTGAIKIGISKDVKRRVKSLQTGSPYKLKVILILKNRADLEKPLHNKLKKYKTKFGSGEWFSFDSLPSLPDWIYEKLSLDKVNTWWEN